MTEKTPGSNVREDLKRVETDWEGMCALDDACTKTLTVEESIRQFLNLCELLPYFQESEEFFRSERERYLTEIQMRLQKLHQWQSKQSGKPVSDDI